MTKRNKITASSLTFCAATLGLSLGASAAHAQLALERIVNIPNVGAEVVTLTPDGRFVTLDNTGAVSLETELGSGQFQNLGQLPNGDFSRFGASFIAVSPDGETLAIGNNGGATFTNAQVGVFELSDISQGRWINTGSFSAHWLDNKNLIVAAGKFGDPSWVYVLDTESPLADAPVTTRIVEGIGGASGGVVLDAEENLWTANGFTSAGPSKTGAVHRVSEDDWKAALAGERGPVNFETEATPVARALSASSIAFDLRGNLWVGGAVTFGENKEADFVARFSSEKVEEVLAGDRGPLDALVDGDATRVDPDPTKAEQNYQVLASPIQDKIFLRESGTDDVFVIRVGRRQAAPVLGGLGTAALLGLGLAGSVAANRKRRAKARCA